MALTGAYGFVSSLQCNVCLLSKDENGTHKVVLRNKRPLKCSSCSLVWYCGKEHQKTDWPNHRQLCTVIKIILQKAKIEHPLQLTGALKCSRDLVDATMALKYMVRHELKRPLNYHEEQLTSFPGYCNVCFGLNNLKPCEKCYAVAYCSKMHAEENAKEHAKVCNLLSLYYCPYKINPVEWNSEIEICQRVEDLTKTDLYGAFECATKRKLPEKPNDSLENYQLYSAAADFSCIGTICMVMESYNMKEYTSKKFFIYIIGATVEQNMWFREQHMKFFFSQYPKITELYLYFIGPEVVGERECHLNFNFQQAEREVVYKSFPVLFQDFVKDYKVNPSLIMAFNCGFSEYAPMPEYQCQKTSSSDVKPSAKKPLDTWSEGLREILRTYGVPIAFTSFSKMECNFDYAAVLRIAQSDDLSIKVQRFFKIDKNPYRDFRPFRNMRTSDREDIYYRNGYVQGFITSLED